MLSVIMKEETGKKKTHKYYFSLSVSGLDGIFDVVYGGDQREQINTNISAV